MRNNIIGENIKRARLLHGLSLREISEKLNISAQAFHKYEKGEVVPDGNRLIEIANILSVNAIELLKVFNKPNISFNSFRKKKNFTGKKLELLKDIIENKVAYYFEALNLLNEQNKNIELNKFFCFTEEDVEKAAQAFRFKIGISDYVPLLNLTNILENMGFIIIYLKDHNGIFKDFDGFSEIIEGIPVIVLLSDKNGLRQRFTLAHELAHILISVEDENKIEKSCDKFASSILLPKEAMIREFGRYRSGIRVKEYENISLEYQVSGQAIIHRLNDLGIINDNVARISYMNWNRRKNDEDDNFKSEESRQLESLVYKLETQGIITISKACDLLGVTYEEYTKEDNYY